MELVVVDNWYELDRMWDDIPIGTKGHAFGHMRWFKLNDYIKAFWGTRREGWGAKYSFELHISIHRPKTKTSSNYGIKAGRNAYKLSKTKMGRKILDGILESGQIKQRLEI